MMVTGDDAAFRVLEIVAILFPLLLIVFQLFARHLLNDRSTLADELSEYLGFFAVSSVFLTAAAIGASMQLMTGSFRAVIFATVGVLYTGMTLIGLSMAFMGRHLQKIIEQQNEQVDLTQSVSQQQTKEGAETDEPSE